MPACEQQFCPDHQQVFGLDNNENDQYIQQNQAVKKFPTDRPYLSMAMKWETEFFCWPHV